MEMCSFKPYLLAVMALAAVRLQRVGAKRRRLFRTDRDDSAAAARIRIAAAVERPVRRLG